MDFTFLSFFNSLSKSFILLTFSCTSTSSGLILILLLTSSSIISISASLIFSYLPRDAALAILYAFSIAFFSSSIFVVEENPQAPSAKTRIPKPEDFKDVKVENVPSLSSIFNFDSSSPLISTYSAFTFLSAQSIIPSRSIQSPGNRISKDSINYFLTGANFEEKFKYIH